MELGKKIKSLRIKAGLTQEQLAEKLNVAAQSVSKWETAAAMPDILLLPLLAETFGVSIDDLFDLTVEQRFRRIENRMDVEEELSEDVFTEYREFLVSQLPTEAHKKRATELLAYLYWHRMNAAAQKVRRYAKDAIRLAPGEKVCQWMLGDAEKHAAWDWNMSNHKRAIDFYRSIVDANPTVRLPYFYLIDNLVADHRADEAEQYLEKLRALPETNPLLCECYRARIELARFDEPAADRIMEGLIDAHPGDPVVLFEAAQFYAGKCDYDKAITLYDQSFDADPARPRYQDALYAISDIHEIRGEYGQAAETYERILHLLETEWGNTEETWYQDAQKEKARLLALAEAQE